MLSQYQVPFFKALTSMAGRKNKMNEMCCFICSKSSRLFLVIFGFY